jgi:hypothetical protein
MALVRGLAETPVPAPGAPRPVSERNRRTAWILLAWIALLMLAAVAVAWIRN